MKLGEVFSGNYLKAEDLRGMTVPVIIKAVEMKEFDDGNKIVVFFEGKEKALVCNKTNANIIAEVLHSDDTDNWVGGKVRLTVKKVEFQGKLVPAIRVVLEESPAVPLRPAPAHQAQPRAAEEPYTGQDDPSDPPF